MTTPGDTPPPQQGSKWDDFAPTPDAPIPNYSQEMTGQGRWFHMRDADGSLYGVLFTNDADVLGLFPVGGTSAPHLRAGLDTLRAAYARGVPATDQFDFLFGAYGPGGMTAGDLQELFG